MGNVLNLQATGSAKWRIRRESLLLTAACVWLINGLHARPDDGPSSRELMKAVLPITEDEDDDLCLAYAPRNGQGGGDDDSEGDEFDWGTPYNPYGAIFIRRLMAKTSINVPRLRRGGPFISPAAFEYWFKASEPEIHHKYFSVGILPREQPINPDRPSTRAKCTPTYITRSGTPEPVIFHLAEEGYRLPTPEIDDGSDNEGFAADETLGSGDINKETTRIWRQFLADVVNKAPNPKKAGLPSYCKLPQSQRNSVKESFFKSRNLSDEWNACQWRVAGKREWNRAFDNMFPPLGHQTHGRAQTYRHCQYYLIWKEICALGQQESVEAMRGSLRKRLFSLAWIPDAAQDKMWPTAAMGNRFERYPPNSKGPAPRILLQKRPTWDDLVVLD
jgi:hypothetical protein